MRGVIDRITPLVEQLKGTIDSVYCTFGDRDLVALVDQGIAAMTKANTVATAYHAPTSTAAHAR